MAAEWLIEQNPDGTCDIKRDRRPATFTYTLDAAKLWLEQDSRSTYRAGEPVYIVDTHGQRERYR